MDGQGAAAWSPAASGRWLGGYGSPSLFSYSLGDQWLGGSATAAPITLSQPQRRHLSSNELIRTSAFHALPIGQAFGCQLS